MTRSTARRTRIAIVTAAVLAASASVRAGGGEALDIELPSMRSPVAAAPVAASSDEAALASISAYAATQFAAAPTREQVREQLRQARANGTLSLHGEAGDTDAVLRARDVANAQIEQAIVAEYTAEHQRQVAFAEAEIRRAEIEQQGLLAAAYGLGEGEVLVEPAGGAAIEAGDTDVRVDVIDLSSSSATWPDELVIVSLDGGDAMAQRERALYLRRQYAAMGLAPRQIYVESKDA